MTTILRIQASARTTGSVSRKLSDAFADAWRSAESDAIVIDRDLGRSPPPAVSEPWIAAAFTPDDQDLGKIDSWAALVEPTLAGRVAVQSDAAIGVIDLVLAVQAAGWFDFADPGNLTPKEIVSFVGRLLALRKKGHFKAFWATEAEAGALVESDKVSITSMWWQGFVGLRRRGVPIRMAVPKEGFRGWYGGLALSRRLDGRRRDVAYEYLNWWLSGYAGAVMSRNNAHISNPKASRP